MQERIITSLQDLLEALEQDNEGYEGEMWFRGQQNEEWKLLPGYYRINNPPPETTFLKRFKQSAAMLINKQPGNSFDWLFLMQHYGVPTRLLDWTESPIIAAYFAVEDNSENKDKAAALWALKPSELNKNANINDENEEFYIPSFDDLELESYSTESLSQNKRIQLLPVATIATRNNSRIQAQLGVFTIHHHDETPIEKLGNSEHIIKYVIPAKNKEKISKQIKLLGYTKFQLFPELSSIGETIKDLKS